MEKGQLVFSIEILEKEDNQGKMMVFELGEGVGTYQIEINKTTPNSCYMSMPPMRLHGTYLVH